MHKLIYPEALSTTHSLTTPKSLSETRPQSPRLLYPAATSVSPFQCPTGPTNSMSPNTNTFSVPNFLPICPGKAAKMLSVINSRVLRPLHRQPTPHQGTSVLLSPQCSLPASSCLQLLQNHGFLLLAFSLSGPFAVLPPDRVTLRPTSSTGSLCLQHKTRISLRFKPLLLSLAFSLTTLPPHSHDLS